MKDLISVIVPIYKVEEYLPKCLDSIINQTYRNLEIILIDDGSPDNCPAICDEYAERDERIKVIHAENGGLSVARNRGVEIATGDFLGFVDSDDCLHSQMYEILYNNLNQYNADISICDYNNVYENESLKNNNGDKKITDQNFSVCEGREALHNLYNELNIITVLTWNKLYKKEIFNNIRYVKGKIHEDEFLIHSLFDRAKTVVYSDAKLYYYLQRCTSIMGEGFNLKKLDYLEALENRMSYFEERRYTALYEKTYQQYLSSLVSNYYLVKQFYPDHVEVTEELITKFSYIYQSHRDIILLSNMTKVKYNTFYYSPLLCRFLLNIKQIAEKLLMRPSQGLS